MEEQKMKEKIVRHHLLEIILWPNPDGTFREIRNSASRLKELGIYNEWKLTIPMTRSEHMSLHNKGEKNPNFGKTLSEETKQRMSESLKGKTPWNKGKKLPPHSEESKQRMSESHKGHPGYWTGKKCKPHSEETKQKMRENHGGGVTQHSEETKQKMREKRIAYWEKKRSLKNTTLNPLLSLF